MDYVFSQPSTPPTATSAPLELLQLQGFDSNQWRRFTDGRPLAGGETNLVLKILSRLSGCRPAQFERWTSGEADVTALAAGPTVNRGAVLSASGRVASLEPVRQSEELAEQLGLKQVFRVLVLLEPQDHKALVYTDRVPQAWSRKSAIGERVAFRGMFVKLAGNDKAEPLPLLVAPRLAWHPATPLGDLGMDAGLLEDLADGKPLTDLDTEAFYQMFAAVRKARPGQLLRQAREELKQTGRQSFPAAALFNEPAKERGQLVSLSGTARRVTRVAVDDPETIARFHLDHYYEIDLFPADAQGNPVVVCVADLPEGTAAGDPANCRVEIELAGFFFKLWRYPVATPDGETPPEGKVAVQSAPLLIGQAAVRAAQGKAATAATGTIAGMMLAMVLVGVWLLLGHLRRNDREMEKEVLSTIVGKQQSP